MKASLTPAQAFKPNRSIASPKREELGTTELFWIIQVIGAICLRRDAHKGL